MNLTLKSFYGLFKDTIKTEIITSPRLFKISFETTFQFINQFETEVLNYRRKNNLWENNCLEVFLATNAEEYFEINLAPEGLWNCYNLKSYRSELIESDIIRLVDVVKQKNKVVFSFDLGEVSPTKCNITAIAKNDNLIDYFAINHGKKPDFHCQKNFVDI